MAGTSNPTPDPSSVSEDELTTVLRADRVLEHHVEAVDYDLQTITTGGRWWVSGRLERAGEVTEFRVFAKLVHRADRSAVWPFIPPEGQVLTLSMLDWRVEPGVYASGLAASLPADLAMPRCYAVRPVDDGSAVIWLDAVPHEDRPWTDDDLVRAARALGRLAGAPDVAAVADRVGHPYGPRQARAY